MVKARTAEPSKCKVKMDWFEKLDSTGKPLGRWLARVAGSSTHVLCTICSSKLNCEYKGFQAISQHSESVKHKQAVKTHLSQRQLAINNDNKTDDTVNGVNIQIPTEVTEMGGEQRRNLLLLIDNRDAATRAEMIWTMKNVSSNFSGKFCDDLGQTLKNMFPNEPACKDFTLASSKLSYMVSDCVGPHFRDIILNDVKKSVAHYTLCFDETTNDASQKELQTSIRYYSESRKRILEAHLETFFIENGKAETIVKYLFLSLSNAKLPIERLLTLSRDGPNVIKKVFRLVKEEFRKRTGKNLIDIGSCDIHIIHNGFKKGLDTYGNNIADLSINLHYYFDGEPLRSEEYRVVQTLNGLVHHRFLKHVPSRWLTLNDSTVRIIEQYSAVEEYFLKWIPKNRPKTMNSVLYKHVVKHFKSTTLKAELYLVKESSELLQLYLKYLQVDAPLIHRLHGILTQILIKILGRIAKPESLVNISTITTENFDTTNLLKIEDINLSKDILQALKDCKDVEKAKFRLDYRNHFKEIGLHILQKTCYKESIVRCVEVIAPSRILDADSSQKILKVADSLPFDVSSTLINEWSLVRATVRVENLSGFKGAIDVFWEQFFDKVTIDKLKAFPVLTKVIQSVLSITHGSGGIERMISQSGLVLSEDKTLMCLRTLNSCLDIKYGLKLFFNDNRNAVPIDKKFIIAARRARQSYNLYLEDIKAKEMELKKKNEESENKEKEKAERNAAICNEKKSLKAIETALKEREKENHQNATTLLKESNDRLKNAIRKKNLNEVSLAQGMIEGRKL